MALGSSVKFLVNSFRSFRVSHFQLLPCTPSTNLTKCCASASSQDVFRPGSASPSAILFEAAEMFDKKSPKADEYIRAIRPELASAVDTCIDAAGREFEVYWQKKLLKVGRIIDFVGESLANLLAF